MKSRCAAFNLVLILSSLVSLSSAEEPWTYVQDKFLTIVKVKDANQFLAYSKKAGDWKRHTFGEKVKALPVLSDSICAFSLTGEQMSELVAVDLRGNFRTTKLAKPTTSGCTPIIGSEVAVYAVDGRVYAFSGLTGTWDSIVSDAKPSTDNDSVMLLGTDSIAIFSSETGKWAETSLKAQPQ